MTLEIFSNLNDLMNVQTPWLRAERISSGSRLQGLGLSAEKPWRGVSTCVPFFPYGLLIGVEDVGVMLWFSLNP